MDQLIEEFAKYGLGSLVGLLFYVMLRNEKKEHTITLEKYHKLLEDRAIDARKTVENIAAPMGTLAEAIDKFTTKIKDNKGTQ